MTTKKPSDAKKPREESAQQKLKKQGEEIERLTRELTEKNDKYLRALADYQNYQKRMDKELVAHEDTLKRRYLTEILDLQELLKKAAEDADPKTGLRMLLANLEKFLEKEGVCYIDCQGKPFDHTLHHAISTVEPKDCEEGTVVEEVKKGYRLGDKLLRPSQVIVAKKNEEPTNEVE
jgi:molecular chaperone GrpE